MRSSRCWVLGGNFGGNQHADEAKNGVGSNAILRTTNITAFFCFLFVLVEVPHARMRKLVVFVCVLNNFPTFLLGAVRVRAAVVRAAVA